MTRKLLCEVFMEKLMDGTPEELAMINRVMKDPEMAAEFFDRMIEHDAKELMRRPERKRMRRGIGSY